METHMIVSIAAAIFVNVLTYVGISAAYFRDKHRVEPPRLELPRAEPTRAEQPLPSHVDGPPATGAGREHQTAA